MAHKLLRSLNPESVRSPQARYILAVCVRHEQGSRPSFSTMTSTLSDSIPKAYSLPSIDLQDAIRIWISIVIWSVLSCIIAIHGTDLTLLKGNLTLRDDIEKRFQKKRMTLR